MDFSGVVPMRLRDVDPRINVVTGNIIDAAIEVQRHLGNGLLEKAYECALTHALKLRGHVVSTQVPVTVRFRDLEIPNAYFLDLLVDGLVPVELKTVEQLDRQHFAQLSTYLRFGNYPAGLLINFHASPLKQGIQRVVRT